MCKKSGLITCNLLLLAMLVIAGCSENEIFEPDDMVTETDAGNDSGGDTDMGSDTSTGVGTDSGTTESGTTDNGTTDSGATESGTTDNGTTDSGTTESGTTDNGTTDSGTTDSGTTDTGTTDAGTGGGTTTNISTVGDANCPPLRAIGNTASIAGLYDLSSLFSEENVAYMEIFDNGSATLYNYLQDDFDQGGNCYLIFSGGLVYTPLGNDLYVLNGYEDPNVNCQVFSETGTLLRGETQLTSISPDTDDEDFDGDTTELITESLPVVVGLTSESFNSCE